MFRAIDLHHLDYAAAWQRQEAIHAEVADGGPEAILFVEHPPVITLGRRAAESAAHVTATRETLEQRGISVIESDRGGDVTFHGPGQIVAYPIVRLADHRLSVGAYVKALEHAVIDTLAGYGIDGFLEPKAIGVWTKMPNALPAESPKKICALGVRIKRGVSMHGIALNVSTDLSYFDLIVPCGLADRGVTSMRQMLGDSCPEMDRIKLDLTRNIANRIDGVCNGATDRENARP